MLFMLCYVQRFSDIVQDPVNDHSTQPITLCSYMIFYFFFRLHNKSILMMYQVCACKEIFFSNLEKIFIYIYIFLIEKKIFLCIEMSTLFFIYGKIFFSVLVRSKKLKSVKRVCRVGLPK